MPKVSKYPKFRSDFMEMIHRFDRIAPLMVTSGDASGEIALNSRRIVELLTQGLPLDDGGALTKDDFKTLQMAIGRAGQLMDTLDAVAATAQTRSGDLNEITLFSSLDDTEPEEIAQLLQTLTLMSSDRNSDPAETLRRICAVDGLGTGFGKTTFEIVKMTLLFILRILARRRVLPRKLVDLIILGAKLVDDIIGRPRPSGNGDDGGGGGGGDGGLFDPFSRPFGFVLKLEDGDTQEFEVAGSRFVTLRYESYTGARGTGTVRIETSPNRTVTPQSLRNVGEVTQAFSSVRRVRLRFNGTRGSSACVRVGLR